MEEAARAAELRPLRELRCRVPARGYRPDGDVAFTDVKLSPVCPAANVLAGPPLGGPSIICGVLARDFGEDPDSRRESEDWHLFTSRNDAGTVHGFCTCPNYVNCAVWENEKDRIAESRRLLTTTEKPNGDLSTILTSEV